MNDAYTKCKVVFSNASYFITMTASPFSVTKDNADSIKLVLEDIDKISDIADTDGDVDAVHEEYVVRDMYHHVFDITEKTLAAESAEKRLYDIGSCDAQPVVFNGKVQGPKVVFNGEVLPRRCGLHLEGMGRQRLVHGSGRVRRNAVRQGKVRGERPGALCHRASTGAVAATGTRTDTRAEPDANNEVEALV